jgi:putative flippase GtrA
MPPTEPRDETGGSITAEIPVPGADAEPAATRAWLAPASALLGALRRPRVAQVLRFGLVGVLGTVVNVALVHLLHTELGWGFTRSSAIATEIAIVHNYVWNELWTFHIRRLHLGRLVRYQMSSLLAAGVTVIVATIVKEFVDPRLAQLVGVLAGAGLNYVVNVRWTWGPRATVPDLAE